MAFTLRLPAELEERLRRFCFDERLSKTDAVVIALEDLLDGRAAPAAKKPEPEKAEESAPVEEEDLGIPLPREKARLLVDPEDCPSPYHHRLGGKCPHCRFEGG